MCCGNPHPAFAICHHWSYSEHVMRSRIETGVDSSSASNVLVLRNETCLIRASEVCALSFYAALKFVWLQWAGDLTVSVHCQSMIDMDSSFPWMEQSVLLYIGALLPPESNMWPPALQRGTWDLLLTKRASHHRELTGGFLSLWLDID